MDGPNKGQEHNKSTKWTDLIKVNLLHKSTKWTDPIRSNNLYKSKKWMDLTRVKKHT